MKPPEKNKKDNKIVGNIGELCACLFLESKGYEIVEKNYRAYRKEIDIIAKKGGYLAFVEVKTRRSANFGLPSESVDWKKQKHIILAAKKYLADNGRFCQRLQPRFDVVEIYCDEKTKKNYVRHIEGAFIN
ncbi:MAG: YraN family protein [Oscillospiraceae bacterium]|nr:YraN family protein [Oscillospiraceae bacterium]